MKKIVAFLLCVFVPIYSVLACPWRRVIKANNLTAGTFNMDTAGTILNANALSGMYTSNVTLDADIDVPDAYSAPVNNVVLNADTFFTNSFSYAAGTTIIGRNPCDLNSSAACPYTYSSSANGPINKGTYINGLSLRGYLINNETTLMPGSIITANSSLMHGFGEIDTGARLKTESEISPQFIIGKGNSALKNGSIIKSGSVLNGNTTTKDTFFINSGAANDSTIKTGSVLKSDTTATPGSVINGETLVNGARLWNTKASIVADRFLAAGSKLKADSILNGTTLDSDTILEADTKVTAKTVIEPGSVYGIVSGATTDYFMIVTDITSDSTLKTGSYIKRESSIISGSTIDGYTLAADAIIENNGFSQTSVIEPGSVITAGSTVNTVTLQDDLTVTGSVIAANSFIAAGSVINGDPYLVDTTIYTNITVTSDTVLAPGTILSDGSSVVFDTDNVQLSTGFKVKQGSVYKAGSTINNSSYSSDSMMGGTSPIQSATTVMAGTMLNIGGVKITGDSTEYGFTFGYSPSWTGFNYEISIVNSPKLLAGSVLNPGSLLKKGSVIQGGDPENTIDEFLGSLFKGNTIGSNDYRYPLTVADNNVETATRDSNYALEMKFVCDEENKAMFHIGFEGTYRLVMLDEANNVVHQEVSAVAYPQGSGYHPDIRCPGVGNYTVKMGVMTLKQDKYNLNQRPLTFDTEYGAALADVTSIKGNMALLFPEFNDPGSTLSASNRVPSFEKFAYQRESLQTVGENLFNDYTIGRDGMFKYAFKECKNLTNAPKFSQLHYGAGSMFDSAFYQAGVDTANGITLPEKMFENLTGESRTINGSTVANYSMFVNAFQGAKIASIGANMFDKLATGEYSMFGRTFQGATIGSIGANMFNKLTTGATSMFDNTFQQANIGTIGANMFNAFTTVPTGATNVFKETFQQSNIESIGQNMFNALETGHNGLFTGVFQQANIGTIGQNMFDKLETGAESMFSQTFQSSTIGTIGSGMFKSLRTGANNMFANTFESANTGTDVPALTLPDGMFSSLENGAELMFDQTFKTANVSAVPANMFSGLKTGAKEMFSSTFIESKVKTMPYNIFRSAGFTPAKDMFKNTFAGCDDLTTYSAQFLTSPNFDGVTISDVSPLWNKTFSTDGASKLATTTMSDGSKLAYVPTEIVNANEDLYADTFQGSGLQPTATNNISCPTGYGADPNYSWNPPAVEYPITALVCGAKISAVTLDANGGTGAGAGFDVLYDGALPATTKPTRTGYVFNGYFTAQTGGTQYYDENADPVGVWKQDEDTVTLYAQWTPLCNTVTLNVGAWGGTGGTDKIYIKSGENSVMYSDDTCETVLAAIELPTKANATFMNYATGLTNPTCIDQHGALTGNCEVLGDVDDWKAFMACNEHYRRDISGPYPFIPDACLPNQYTVTFNKNDGNGDTLASTKCTYADETCNLAERGTLKKNQNVFMGWNTAQDGTGTHYAAGNGAANPISETTPGDITLYAQWAPVVCNTDSTVISTSTFVDNQNRPGCNYECAAGHHAGADNGTVIGVANQTNVDAACILNQTTYTLDTNGATWSDDSKTWGQEITGTQSLFDVINNPGEKKSYMSKAGHKFIGWSTTQSADNIVTGNILAKPDEENVTLYAIWEQCSAGTFHLGGRTDSMYPNQCAPCPVGTTSAAGASVCTPCQNGLTTTDEAATSCNAQCSNYSDNVATWATASWTGRDQYNPGSFNNPYVLRSYTNNLCTPTACAVGSHFENCGDENASQSYKECIPCDNGYSCAGGYACPTLIEYTINYHDAAGVVNTNPTTYSVESADITLQNPTRLGYTFGGWYSDENLATPANEIPSASIGNKDFWAKWTLDTYTITYNLDNGTNADTNPATYTVESADITLAAPTKTGHTFGGWYNNAEFTGDAITTIAAGSTGNKTLYAKWTANQYTITFNNDGETKTLDVNFNQTMSNIPAADMPTKNGYSFLGYFDADDEKYYNEDGTSVKTTWDVQHNVSLNAKWEIIEYTINYTLNGGENSDDNPASYTVNDTPIVLAAPTRAGFGFGGWYNNATFSGAAITTITATTLGNKELYANWTRDDYTITYNLDDGVNADDNPETYTVESADITLGAPTRTGYTFNGWYSDSGMTTAATGIPTGSTGNKEFWAKWTINTYTVEPGYYLPAGATEAAECEENSFCEGGDFNFNPTETQGTESCPTNFTSSAGAGAKTDCARDVPAGYYLPMGETEPEICPADSYCAGGALAFNDVADAGIVACPDGYTDNTDTGKSAITQCQIKMAAGFFVDTPGRNTNFTACSVGEYKGEHMVDYGATSECDKCSNLGGGLFDLTRGAGATSPNECFAKLYGYKYITTPDADATAACPADHWCPAMNVFWDENLSNANLNSCPTDFHSTEGGAMAESECAVTVPAGFVKTSANSATIEKCPAGTYSEEHTSQYGWDDATACKPCTGTNKFSAAGAGACETVQPGYYATGCTSGSRCTGQEQCTGATWCSDGQKHDCPTGFDANIAPGKTSIAQCQIEVPGGKYITIDNGNYVLGTCWARTYSVTRVVSVPDVANDVSSCMECADGTYSGPGATECIPARNGYFVHPDKIHEIACAKGSYSAQASGSDKCTVCPAGRTTQSTATKYPSDGNPETACDVLCDDTFNYVDEYYDVSGIAGWHVSDTATNQLSRAECYISQCATCQPDATRGAIGCDRARLVRNGGFEDPGMCTFAGFTEENGTCATGYENFHIVNGNVGVCDPISFIAYLSIGTANTLDGTCNGATKNEKSSLHCTYGQDCLLPEWNTDTCRVSNGAKILTGWTVDGTEYQFNGNLKNYTSNPNQHPAVIAQWSDTTCVVDNGTGTPIDAVNNTPRCSVTCNDGYAISWEPDNVQTSGEFSGEQNGTTVTAECQPLPTHTITLHKFGPNPSLKMAGKFSGGSHTVSTNGANHDETITCVHGETVTLPDTFTKESGAGQTYTWTAGAWSDTQGVAPTGTGLNTIECYADGDKDIELFAWATMQWKLNKEPFASVKLNNDADGKGFKEQVHNNITGEDTLTCYYGGTVELPTISRSQLDGGYRYAGWRTSANESATAHDSLECTSAYTLYAKYDPCPANHYCPIRGSGSTLLGDEEEDIPCPDGYVSDAGSNEIGQCYQVCDQPGVTAIEDTVSYPNVCEYLSATGNPCVMHNGVCKETSCSSLYEMINGVCVKCERENALTFDTEHGNCIISTCVAGYHPMGSACVPDSAPCNIPNAIAAEQQWDNKLNAFGACMALECEDGFHLASNACVADTEPCEVENGTGERQWNPKINDWDECIATYCEPGYTRDPSDAAANDRAKQCGRCGNKFSSTGEVAVSSYVRECEIASCMYQGEFYKLEDNECKPICEDGYSDETGTLHWDAKSGKCVHQCNPGYTAW